MTTHFEKRFSEYIPLRDSIGKELSNLMDKGDDRTEQLLYLLIEFAIISVNDDCINGGEEITREVIKNILRHNLRNHIAALSPLSL